MAAKSFSVDAIQIKYNDHMMYVCSIKTNDLFPLAKVSRADEDAEKGFQRLLGKQRAKQISEYLKNGNIIPGALVISAQDSSLISYNKTNKKLKIQKHPGSLLVIDGQHRLYGAHESGLNIQLVVCILCGLSDTQEVQYFLDVNGYQRGVPRTLQLELTKFTAEPESIDEKLNDIFTELDENPKSPLIGKMARTRSVQGKISHVSYRSVVKPLFEKAPFSAFKFDQQKKVIINYLQAVDKHLSEKFDGEPKLTNAAFFQAIMGLFIDSCELAYIENKSFNEKSFYKTLEGIGALNYEVHKGTNKKAIKGLTEELKSLILVRNKFTDDIF